MDFLVYNLGHLHASTVVEVTLRGSGANVMLLDDLNLSHYRRGDRFEYFGGLATLSPVTLTVPRTGSWNVVVDLGGGAGRVDASVRVLTTR
jgi:hypothetical protein